MNEKNIRQYKNIFQDTFRQFENCLKGFNSLCENDKKLADKITQDWKSRLNDDNWLQNFVRIENFQTIVGFKNELSCKLSFPDLVGKVAQHFGEIDCAIHLLREFPQKIDNAEIKVEKILKQNNLSVCDFRVHTSIPHLIEVKTISKFNESKIRQYTEKALNQIESSRNNNSCYGVVWIFTFDIPQNLTSVQTTIEKIKSSIIKPFKYNLTVQVYLLGLWGDCTFRMD